MAERSGIEWTDATWQPITGCSVVSPGCTHCYAMKLAGGRLKHHPSRAGLTRPSKAGPVWTGEVRLNEGWLAQPLRWTKPLRIFACAHGDLFHESVPVEWIDDTVIVMALADWHTFQVLTKRSARMRAYFSDPTLMGRLARRALQGFPAIAGHPNVRRFLFSAADRFRFPFPNIWLGVSAEDQPRADERLLDLMATPAAVRWLSAEPLLGPMDIGWALSRNPLEIAAGFLRRARFSPGLETLQGLDLVVAGGESGPGARPMHPDWARGLRDACAMAGRAFFFKQWGGWVATYDRDQDDPDWQKRAEVPRTALGRWLNLAGGQGFHGDRVVWVTPASKKTAGRRLDGVEHNAMPEPAYG